VLVLETGEVGYDSLEDLFKNEGFVGYEKEKDYIEDVILTPWKDREKYVQRFQENVHFKNIKNVIPNCVLFEGPP
jgi:hypothetical protein